jgi:DNA-binding transcriptional MerR regulator
MSALPDVQIGNEDPIYNIGAVSRMTDLSMATLRAWERRYGFPKLERTEGGHRLYSEQDVIKLNWVHARIEEGMQTARAIQALGNQVEMGHTISNYEPRNLLPVDITDHSDYFDIFVVHLFDALVNKHDLNLANELFNETLAFIAPEQIILEGITPLLSRIGESWESGDISISGEHFATNYLRQRLLYWMLTGPPPMIKQPIVLACAPGELHEGSLLVLGAILRRRRYPVAYLGQTVPFNDLEAFVTEMKAPLLILVATLEDAATELISGIQKLFEKSKAKIPTIGYGGRAFIHRPDLQKKMIGEYLGDTLEEGIQAIDRILS